MPHHKTSLVISLVLLVSACTGGTKTTQNPYIDQAMLALQDVYIEGAYDKQAGLEALRLATLSGQVDLEWQASLMLCHNDINFCDDALQLAHLLPQESNEAVFDSYVTTFLAHGNDDALEAANRFATTHRQRSIVLILQGEQHSIDGAQLSPEERALLLFNLGKQQSNRQSLEFASREFFQQENYRGSADASFLAAKLALQEGNSPQAKRLAYSSKRLLSAIHRSDLASAVDTWIQANL